MRRALSLLFVTVWSGLSLGAPFQFSDPALHPFRPHMVSGIAARYQPYRAMQVTLNGVGAAVVNDTSGFGRNLTNGTASAQPQLTRTDNCGNLLVQSETFATTWTRTRINAFGATDTGAAGAGSFANTSRTTDPLGGNTADFLQEDNSSSTSHFLELAVSAPTGSYSAYIWCKPAGRTWIRYGFGTASSTDNVRGSFDVQTGTNGASVALTGGASNGSQSIVSAGNGWWLCRVSATMPGPIAVFTLAIAEADNDVVFTGDNTSGLYVWGASLVPASYTPVTGPTAAQGYIATVATPAYAGVNGLAALRFDGTDDYLKTVFTLPQPVYVALAWRPITWTSGDTVIDGSADLSMQLRQAGSSPQVSLFNGAGVAANTGFSLGSWHVGTIGIDGASSFTRRNLEAAVTGDFGSSTPGGISLGTRGSAASGFSNIEVAEVIPYSRTPSSVEQSYLVQGLGRLTATPLW